jgi:hypothetical protein
LQQHILSPEAAGVRKSAKARLRDVELEVAILRETESFAYDVWKNQPAATDI